MICSEDTSTILVMVCGGSTEGQMESLVGMICETAGTE